MKFSPILLIALLPFALAAPVAEAGAAPAAIPEAEPIAEPIAEPLAEPAGLFKRAQCSIIGNDGPVACRSGPARRFAQVGNRLPVGSTYTFSCYKRGECVFGNW